MQVALSCPRPFPHLSPSPTSHLAAPCRCKSSSTCSATSTTTTTLPIAPHRGECPAVAVDATAMYSLRRYGARVCVCYMFHPLYDEKTLVELILVEEGKSFKTRELDA